MSEWGLVGRASELDRVGEMLADGGAGVVLAGAPGVGKTRLGMECLKLAAARGYATATAMATRCSRGLPLGAMAPLLPEPIAPGLGPADLLRRAASAIGERGEGRPVALLVDDAHWLDDVSATLVEQLVLGRSAFVIVTVGSGEPAPDAVIGLWKNELAERLDLGPLDGEAQYQLLRRVLGASVEGATLRRLTRSCAGNALYLRELVLAALDSGVLVNDGGLCRLTGPLVISTRLVELIQSRLDELSPAERGALELTALGEPVEVAFVEAHWGAESLDALERRGLVTSSASGRRLQLRLGHPLYGDVLLSRLPATSVRSMKRSLADWLDRAGVRRLDDAMRFATWRLDGGGEVRHEAMLTGARAAQDRWDLPLAERLAAAAAGAGGGFAADLMVGHLAWLQGRSVEAEQRLAALAPLAQDDLQRTMLTATRMDNLLFGLGRSADAIAVGLEAEAAIEDQACRDEISSQRARVSYLSGDTRVAIEVLDPLIGRVQGRTLVSVAMTGASCLANAGRLAEAIALAERGYAAHLAEVDTSMMLGPYVHRMTRFMALMYAGRLDEAEADGTQQYDVAVAEGSREAQGLVSAFLARVALARGRPVTATRFGREAASLLRQRGSQYFLRVALIPLAMALGLSGDMSGAAAALDEVDSLGFPPRTTWGPEILQARGWVAAAAADLPAARACLWGAVAMARTNGDLVHEAAALHDLARLGQAPQVVDPLGSLLSAVEGVLTQARFDHVAALAGRDATALASCSAAFESMGSNLLAAEAALSAAVTLRRAGEPRKAAALDRRAAMLSRLCEGATTPALAALESQVLLSARELEVASLAVAGLSNREIAERLYLSVRTVENQLQRVYEKLGVTRRADLAEVLKPS